MTPRVSREAERDLDDLEAWLVANWGPKAAANVIEAILSKIASLPELPYAGVPRPEVGEGVRFVISGRHLIYYEASERGLLVLRILHAAQDRDVIMRKLKS
jgi:toxin ParE1/3/4